MPPDSASPEHFGPDLEGILDLGDVAAAETELTAIYAKFGQAMALMQSLEMYVVQMIGYERLSRQKPGKFFDVDRLLNTRLKQPLGTNLKELKDLLDSVPRLEELERATELRNHLAHAYWRDRLVLVGHRAGRESLAQELDQVVSWLISLLESIAADTAEVWPANGLTDADFQSIGTHLSAVFNGNASMVPYWRIGDRGPELPTPNRSARPGDFNGAPAADETSREVRDELVRDGAVDEGLESTTGLPDAGPLPAGDASL